MRKLEPKFEGWPLENPPQTEEERHIALSLGFVELSSGLARPPRDFRPPLEIIQKYPYGHQCRAVNRASVVKNLAISIVFPATTS
jgi:hypothetical protein